MLKLSRWGYSIAVDNDDIGGVVTSAKGPEAGVWVIAETKDLPTKFVKIVVTDDRGRYLLPDLPKANFNVWVRGYGLVDSPKVQAAPGKVLNLTAVVAPNPRAAADYYPAGYWLSLIRVPEKILFFKQKTAYEISTCLEFRRVLFRSRQQRRVEGDLRQRQDLLVVPDRR